MSSSAAPSASFALPVSPLSTPSTSDATASPWTASQTSPLQNPPTQHTSKPPPFTNDASIRAPQPGSALVKIEKILEDIYDNLNGSRPLHIPFIRRPHRLLPVQTLQNDLPAHAPCGTRKVLYFPGKSPAESKLFTQVLTVLRLSHQTLLAGTVVTKRHVHGWNIFYQNRDLFGSQGVVDTIVDDLAYTLHVGRDALSIVAAGVGVVCGQIDFSMKEGPHVSASHQENGLVIPQLRSISEVDISCCQWILVIEKEATFRTLAATEYWRNSIAGPGALITSKGYPTLDTRLFLNYLHTAKPELPIFGLVDYDPHGIRILRTYQHGSARLRHEHNATVPEMRWLGIRSHDLLCSHAVDVYQGWSPLHDAMTLTDADRRNAVLLLHELSHCLNTHDLGTQHQFRELQVMLMLNVKAEIQAADDGGDLTAWLDAAFSRVQMADVWAV